MFENKGQWGNMLNHLVVLTRNLRLVTKGYFFFSSKFGAGYSKKLHCNLITQRQHTLLIFMFDFTSNEMLLQAKTHTALKIYLHLCTRFVPVGEDVTTISRRDNSATRRLRTG